MLPRQLLQDINNITPVERQQILGHGRNVPDVKTKLPENDSSIILMPFANFFDHCKIAVTKSNRFSYVPAHTHKFIEMNYVLSGNSSQYIDDHKINLSKGQLLIMDRSVMQRINYASKDDLLINILIRDDAAIRQLLDGLQVQQNQVSRFLFNATQKYFNHNNYQIFDFSTNPTAQRLIETIIINGWKNDGSHNQILFLLVKALLLSSEGSLIRQQTNFIDSQTDTLIPVINYLNTHFRDINLQKLADHFGYNPNYLGDKIKNEMGHSFKELLQLRRLNIASNLIEQTNMSISEISEYVGYENHSSLFRLFKQILHTTPTAYRERVTHPHQIDIDAGYFKKFTKAQKNME